MGMAKEFVAPPPPAPAGTVRLEELVHGRCNFQDQVFRAAVREFMGRMVPGFPLGLLDTNEWGRWEVTPEKVHKIEKVITTVWVCQACEEEWTEEEVESMGGACCFMEHLAAQGQEDADSEEEQEPLVEEKKEWCAIKNTNTGDIVCGSEYVLLDDGTKVEVRPWDEADEAEEEIGGLDQDYDMENRHGHPWANGWCFMPDSSISDDELDEAGFTVASYVGGNGDPMICEDYRLCGIDGGGYDFLGSHFCSLYAVYCQNRKIKVPTEKGHLLITIE